MSVVYSKPSALLEASSLSPSYSHSPQSTYSTYDFGKMNSLDGKIVLLTGAAGGFGRAISSAILAEGCKARVSLSFLSRCRCSSRILLKLKGCGPFQHSFKFGILTKISFSFQ